MAQGRKVVAYGAIRRPSRSVKRQGRSDPSAAQGVKSQTRSNPKQAGNAEHRAQRNLQPVREL